MPDWKDYVRDNLPPLTLGPERESEMVDEMAQHLEAVYEEALSEGASEQYAYRRAVAHIKDWQLLECELIRAKRPIASNWVNNSLARDARIQSQNRTGGSAMGSFLQDLRYGIRMLLKSKAFTGIAVLSLALGIGANTALFSLIDAVMLKMLPVRNPSELVLFNWLSGPRGLARGITGTTNRDPNGMTTSTSFSYPAFERIRDNNQTLSDVFAFAQLYELNVSVDGQPEIAGGQLVSGNYYSGLGVRAIMGRTIAADDDTAAANPVVVITHRYWQRRFAGDPEIVGRTVFVNNVPATIIGVTPPEFFGALQVGQSADLSIPFSIQPRLNPGENNLTKPWYWWVQIMGRLNPGVTGEQAAAGFEGIFQQSAQEGWTAALTQLPSNARVLDPAPRDVPKLRWAPEVRDLPKRAGTIRSRSRFSWSSSGLCCSSHAPM